MESSKAKAIARLQRAIDAIPAIKSAGSGSQEFSKWYRNTQIAIANTFGETTRHSTDFSNVSYSLGAFTTSTPDSAFERAFQSGMSSAESILESMVEEIEEYWDAAPPEVPERDTSTDGDGPQSRSVFVIHGRDEAAKEAVARFLELLDLDPIILHEKPNEGSTLIEKFERHADVGFAIALLTPDDVGALAEDRENLEPRARQNVVLELGYFMGRLGRQRVCALLKGGVEVPSDMAGIVYIPLDDAGAWRIAVVKELKASGLDVDANKAL